MAQRITVIGTGYLGATHAVSMAALGLEVLGVDVDPEKIAALAAGRGAVLRTRPARAAQRRPRSRDGCASRPTSTRPRRSRDVHFICVGTPQQTGSNAADLQLRRLGLRRARARIDRPALLVGKSTVPVGTAARLAELVREVSPGR